MILFKHLDHHSSPISSRSTSYKRVKMDHQELPECTRLPIPHRPLASLNKSMETISDHFSLSRTEMLSTYSHMFLSSSYPSTEYFCACFVDPCRGSFCSTILVLGISLRGTHLGNTLSTVSLNPSSELTLLYLSSSGLSSLARGCSLRCKGSYSLRSARH